MPPIDRRRRRRRLSGAGAFAVVGVVAVALVVAVLAGGLLRMRSQSAGYERALDRSYAAQVRPFVATSNRLGARFHAFLGSMTGQTRTSLELTLDTLVRTSASLASDVATAASPAPSGGGGADVAAAMADRAQAMLTLRTAVDRLLGMSPLPVTGAPDPSSGAAVRPISATGAADQLSTVGSLLAQGDRDYALGRQSLRRAPGGAVLPSSVWSGRTTAWTSAGTLAIANALASSGTLAAVHRVALVAHTLALTPAPVPVSGAGTAGVAVVPPTGHIGLSVVVANDGNVAEQGVVVRDSIRETATSGTSTSSPSTSATATVHTGKPRRVSLAARSSLSVSLSSVHVVPGHRYTIVVTLGPSVPDVPGTVTSDSVSVRVAPPGPPTVGQLLPVKGPGRGGTLVTILGSGFTWVSGVTFGTSPAHFKVLSSTQITAVAPPGSGTVAVHVANLGGVSAVSVGDGFSYRHK